MEIPNYSVVSSFVEELEKEYDLEPRLGRYKSLSPELLELAAEAGLTEEIDASRALFIADYVVTSSEVPADASDEERRVSIIRTIKKGIGRCEDTDKLMRVFYLSQKVKQAIKRNDYFLAGRGLDREPALVILKDIFVTPYQQVCRDLLGEGDQSWELGVLASALKQTLPHEEVESAGRDLEYVWKQMKAYAETLEVEKNDTMSIPNVEGSQLILLLQRPKELPVVCLSNIDVVPQKEEKETIENLLNFMERSDSDKPLVYVNSDIVGTSENLIIVRNPETEGKPLMFLKTQVDELNVSEVQAILAQRSGDGFAWKQLEGSSRIVRERKTIEEEKEFEVEKEVEEEVPREVIDEVEEEGGFFSRLLARIGLRRRKKAVKRIVKEKKKRKVKSKEKRKVKKEIEKKKPMGDELPNFIADALLTLSLGDLDLFQIWDTVRESDYTVVGALESDFRANKTTFVVEEEGGAPESFAETLDGLDQVVEKMMAYFFGIDADVLPNELLFVTKIGARTLNYYISFDHNEDRLVGIIALTSGGKVETYADQEEETLNRRTLHMRTRQLLSSRAHTPLDTSIERILGELLKKDARTITLDRAILSLHEKAEVVAD